jgi:hypothetical protein
VKVIDEILDLSVFGTRQAIERNTDAYHRSFSSLN